MGKKPRSQRRKKGSSLGEQDGGNDTGSVEVLSEDHTVADTISLFEESFSEGDNLADLVDIDDHFESGSGDVTAAASAAVARHSRLVDALNSVADLHTEKRTATREGYIRRLFRALTQFATGEMGQATVATSDTIIPACIAGLRGGVASPAEQYAACRVIEATAVVLGGDNDDFCETMEPHLRRIVMATGRATPVRGAALRALSMSNFICSTDEDTTQALLNLCEAVCAPSYRGEEVAPTLRATALDCWALLSTTVHDAYIAGDDDCNTGRGCVILPLLKQCLDHTNVELRSAAGECVALIHESRLNLGIDEDEGENASARRFRRGSWDGTEWEVLIDEVKQRVAELSVESGRHMSKKAKKQQRATFREFMSTIVDDEPPCEEVHFRGGTITLNSWREVVQLNFVRHCLQGGFQIQLMTNETLQSIFGCEFNNTAHLSQLEKRLTMSKTSEAAKSADQDLARRRRNRTNVKNHFLTADGEDI